MIGIRLNLIHCAMTDSQLSAGDLGNICLCCYVIDDTVLGIQYVIIIRNPVNSAFNARMLLN